MEEADTTVTVQHTAVEELAAYERSKNAEAAVATQQQDQKHHRVDVAAKDLPAVVVAVVVEEGIGVVAVVEEALVDVVEEVLVAVVAVAVVAVVRIEVDMTTCFVATTRKTQPFLSFAD